MNGATLEERYKSLRNNPEYKKDWERLQRASEDEFDSVCKELIRKYQVEKFPNPNYDPQKRSKEKIWPAQKTERKHIPLEEYVRVKIEGARENDPQELKDYAAWYKELVKKEERASIPFSSNDELAEWEKLREQGQFQELRKLQVQKIESWLLANPGLVEDMLKPDPLRTAFMDNKGISYSPLLGLYWVTAYTVIRLFGITNETLFLKLRDRISRIYNRKFVDRSASLALASPVEETRNASLRKIQDRAEGISNIPYHLATTIPGLAQVPKVIAVSIETYLYKCIENALKGDWKKNHRYINVDVTNWKTPPQSAAEMIGKAIGTLMIEKIFGNPIDRVIAENQGKEDSEIAGIIRERFRKSMTKQAVQKRRAKNIVPVMREILEVKVVRNDLEQREGRKTPPIEEDLEESLMNHVLTVKGLNSGE